jgi:hypothetical protein
MLVVMTLVGLWHGANWTFVMWGVYHGLLLAGYRLFHRATAGTAIDKVMKNHWFMPFSVGAMFTAFVLSAPFFRGKTLQSSGYILGALFGSTHITGEFLLSTGTIVLIFISLFLTVAQERSQFIDRLALQPARIQIPAYLLAFLALELFPRPARCRSFIFSFEERPRPSLGPWRVIKACTAQ